MRSIAILTLLALVNMFISCATGPHQTRLNEGKNVASREISAFVLATMIEGYTKTSGEEIVFPGKAGIYDKRSETISGFLDNGTADSAAIDEIARVRLRQGTLDGFRPHVVERSVFLVHARYDPWQIVDGVSVQKGQTISLEEHGGTYDAANHLIEGRTDDSTEITIDASRVYAIIPAGSAWEKSSVARGIFGFGIMMLFPILLILNDDV